ncbi:MAG: glycosyltransferase family 9 protein [Rubrivivax sp.]|nr:glycosyltransferase family 9 protein [Rubrivivax sp.]
MIVRLRNWVGDVVLALPMLQRLAAAGFELQLVGKGWARDLLAGEGWPVHALPRTTRERVALLRRLRAEARGSRDNPGRDRGRIDALCLPDSFSSALEFRLAGLRALGHAWEGRGWLLTRAVPRRRGQHEGEVYWRLGDALLGQVRPPPGLVHLRTTAAQQQAARELLAAHGIAPGFVVVCPFSGGTWNGQEKNWPGFADFVAGALPGLGRPVLVLPGPGAEEAVARERFASTLLLPGVGLGVYAALLRDAALMISNDTGPGHLAAAVGTPLLSVLGPSDPTLWRPWGERVQVLGGHGRWPAAEEVLQAAAALLAPAPPAAAPPTPAQPMPR